MLYMYPVKVSVLIIFIIFFSISPGNKQPESDCYKYFDPDYPQNHSFLYSSDSIYMAQFIVHEDKKKSLIALRHETNEIIKFPDQNVTAFAWLENAYKIILTVDGYGNMPGIYLWDVENNSIKQIVKPINKRKNQDIFLDSFILSGLSKDQKRIYYFYSDDYRTILKNYPRIDNLYAVDIDGSNKQKCSVKKITPQYNCYKNLNPDYSRIELTLESGDNKYRGQYIGTWCEARILIVLDYETNKVIQFPDIGVRGFAWLANTHKIVLAIDAAGNMPGIYLWDVENNSIKQLVKPENRFKDTETFLDLFMLSAVSDEQRNIYYFYAYDTNTIPDNFPSIDDLYSVDIKDGEPTKCIK